MRLKINLINKMNILRIIAWAEGISYLLFGISMPLKYGLDIPEPNYIIGMAHGILFVLYVLNLGLVHFQHQWKLIISIKAFIASFIPFGTFYADKKWFRNY